MVLSILKYRLAIFDSDGTLADTLPWMRSMFNELAMEHGFRRVEPHEYERFRDIHGHALLRELGLPLWKLPRVLTDLRRRMAKHTGSLSLFPGISDALHRLAACGIQLAIVSSNSRANIERVLGADSARLIAHFACGSDRCSIANWIRARLLWRPSFVLMFVRFFVLRQDACAFAAFRHHSARIKMKTGFTPICRRTKPSNQKRLTTARVNTPKWSSSGLSADAFGSEAVVGELGRQEPRDDGFSATAS